MAKLILSLDGVVIREIPLTKERTTIGRKAHNDVHIDNLAVSGEHAVIVTVVEDHFLEDLGSTNGTLVNGLPAKTHLLKNNDLIELGKYKLLFVGKSPPPAQDSADYEKTMVWRPAGVKPAPDPPHATPAGQSPAAAKPAAPPAPVAAVAAATAESKPAPITPKPAPAAPMAAATRGVIRILAGVRAGKEIELTNPITTLGKPKQQVAVLTRRAQGYFLSHVEGPNPPQVNGQSIGTAPYPLKDHDTIELTGVKVEFLLRSSLGEPIEKRNWTSSLLVLLLLVFAYLVWRMRDDRKSTRLNSSH